MAGEKNRLRVVANFRLFEKKILESKAWPSDPRQLWNLQPNKANKFPLVEVFATVLAPLLQVLGGKISLE